MNYKLNYNNLIKKLNKRIARLKHSLREFSMKDRSGSHPINDYFDPKMQNKTRESRKRIKLKERAKKLKRKFRLSTGLQDRNKT